jgi:aminoglycoside phosphotransferase
LSPQNRTFRISPSNRNGQYSADMATIPTSKPVNDDFFRRFLTLAAIKLLKRFVCRQSMVLFLTSKICVKYSTFQHLSEASTMQFIAQHTSIPVPRVYCAFERKGWTYIIQERIDGENVAVGWDKRSEESKAKILLQLKGMVKEMRALPPPGPAVSNVDGGPIYDPRIRGAEHFGPWSTVQEFHRYLRHGTVELSPELPSEIHEVIKQHEGPWPAPCFTHGDLSSLNIMVRGDKVVGIVDWETAGWYPNYWEYTTAWNVNPYNEFWREEVDKFLEPMPVELEMERLRNKYWGLG